MLRERSYGIAPRGLATSFVETEVPAEYATAFRNRFINAAGGAEMRQGMRLYGVAITGNPNLTGYHELVLKDGTTIEFASGGGNLYRRDSATSWTQVGTDFSPGTTFPLRSIQFDTKLVFYNGVTTNFYTEDGIIFRSLRAQIATGSMANASAAGFADSNVGSFLSLGAAANDLVYNITRGAYGIVTAVTSAAIVHTEISSSATGNGTASSGQQTTGDTYQLIDMVEMNIIPTNLDPDNTATAGAGTNSTTVVVSAVSNWLTTELRAFDTIYNATRAAQTFVTSIATAALTTTAVSGQTSGDSLVFLKTAMPESKRIHVHYGRVFHIDARDQTKIRISGPNDIQDMTNGATLDSSTFKFGGQQPTGDIAVSMSSFQAYFIIGGRRNIYFYSGSDPLDTANWRPGGLFPQGIVAADAMLSIGNDAAFLGRDGVQTVSQVGLGSTLGRANVSEAIKVTIRDEIANNPASSIQIFHYPRRAWFLVKIGTKIYCFNYTAFFGGKPGDNASTLSGTQGSWSVFDGKFARQNFYFVNSSGKLLCCGPAGRVYEFDAGDYADDGEAYSTEFQTGHLGMVEPKKTIRMKEGVYIKPTILPGAPITYTVDVIGHYNTQESSDSVTIPTSGATSPVGIALVGSAVVDGTTVFNTKYPLRWRGEAARFRFTTPGGVGPDVLSRFVVYWNLHGKE